MPKKTKEKKQLLLTSWSKDEGTVAILIEGKHYKYRIWDWAIMERILNKKVFTFKDLNTIKERSDLIGGLNE